MCSGLYFPFRNKRSHRHQTSERTNELVVFFFSLSLVFSPNSHFTHALHLFLMNCGNIANVSITMQSIDKIRFCLCPEFYSRFDSFCNGIDGNVFELSLNEWMRISDFLNIWNSINKLLLSICHILLFFALLIFFCCTDASFHRCLLFWKCFDISRQMVFFSISLCYSGKSFYLKQNAMKTDRKSSISAHEFLCIWWNKIFFKYARKYWIELKWWWYRRKCVR